MEMVFIANRERLSLTTKSEQDEGGMSRKFRVAVILLFSFLVIGSLQSIPLQAAEKKAKERLAVIDLEAKYGVDKALAEALSVIVRDKLHSFGEYQVMSTEDIQQVAGREQLMQAIGCDDAAGQCLVDFGRKIDSRYMVAGDISKIGATYSISLRMLDTKGEGAGVTNRVSESCKCAEDELIVTVQNVAAKLVGKPTLTAATKKAEEEAKKLAEEKKKAELIEKQRLAEEKRKIGLTVAPTATQSQSVDSDARALAKAMTVYLQFSKQGIEELTELAKGGDYFSAMMLERSYRRGVGGALKDEIAAKRWKEGAQKALASLEHLADKGDVVALSWLGNHFRDSEILNEQRNATRYFEKAAKQEYAYAMNALGEFYYSGKGGLEKDEVKAVEWYRKAANKNYALGMANLGVMYERGKGGLAQDETKAVEWYREAADNGNPLGMANLGYMYERGKGGLAQDETKAVEWYRKAADNGNARGMVNLGEMCRRGKGGLAQDETKAVEWYQKAADNGNALGMANLGVMYEKGKGGIAQDEAKAVEWYRKAADNGNALGMNNLGVMFEKGKGGLAQDKAKAVEWYKKAVKAGNESAIKRLQELGHE